MWHHGPIAPRCPKCEAKRLNYISELLSITGRGRLMQAVTKVSKMNTSGYLMQNNSRIMQRYSSWELLGFLTSMLSGSFGKKVGQLLRLRVSASMRKEEFPCNFNPFCTSNHHVPPHTMTIHDVGPRPVLGALKIHENSMVRIQCILLRKTSHAYNFSMNSGKTKARKLTKIGANRSLFLLHWLVVVQSLP